MRKIVLFLMFSVGGLMLFAQKNIIVGRVLDHVGHHVHDDIDSAVLFLSTSFGRAWRKKCH